jgi:nuclear pore complex protein Nup98-Nup96
MRTQVETWKSGNNESHISKPYRRVYAVLAGIVDVLQGVRDRDPVNASADVAVAEGLDWLRALGLHFWYGTPLEASIAEALNAFRSHLEGIHPPAQPTLSSASKTSSAQDAIYKMLTLYCDEDQSLDTLLRADGYNASPLDVSVQWHLYNILARSLGVRDVEDRLNGAGSVTADKLTIDYAAQLEAAGLWTQAVFVLLHLELPQR